MYRLAICGLAVLAVASAARAAPTHPSPDPASLAVPPEQLARARDLVRQLGSEAYRTRDRAARELAEMGRAALPALASGRDDPDPEVRMRVVALLPRAEADELRARVETFLADSEAKYAHDLPGFNRFRAVAGDDRDARDLFAEILKNRANYDLLLALRGIPAEKVPPLAAAAGAVAAAGPEAPPLGELNLVLAARRLDVQFRVYQQAAASGGRQATPDLTDIALMLLAESLLPDSKAPFNPFQYQFANFLYQEPLRSAAVGKGKHGPALRRLVIHWMDTRDGVSGLSNAVSMATNLGLGTDAVCKYAARQLAVDAAPPWVKAGAALTLARYNGKDHLLDVTRVFGDEEVLVRGGMLNNPQADVQVRDLALAMALLLTGQDPAGYGFTVGNGHEQMKYQQTNYRFQPGGERSGDEKRAAAFARWREWELGLHAAVAGPPAAAPLLAKKYPEKAPKGKDAAAGKPADDDE
jgi:hypothetical protein